MRRIWKKSKNNKRIHKMAYTRFERLLKIVPIEVLQKASDKWCQSRIAPIESILLEMYNKHIGGGDD